MKVYIPDTLRSYTGDQRTVAAQGVTLMNVRDDDRVSAVALVVESEATSATVGEDAVDGTEVLEGDAGIDDETPVEASDTGSGDDEPDEAEG